MKKLNLKKLKSCYFVGCEFGDDNGAFRDGSENNRMWCSLVEALEEAKSLIRLVDLERVIDMQEAEQWLERFIDEDEG